MPLWCQGAGKQPPVRRGFRGHRTVPGRVRRVRWLSTAGGAQPVQPQRTLTPPGSRVRRHLEAVRLLLDHGARPSPMPGSLGGSLAPLIGAAGNGHTAVVRLLLNQGAKPSPPNSEGTTPLMAAAANGHVAVVRELVARGAALESVFPGTGSTAFHGACAANQPGCVEALVRAGCEVGVETRNGMTGQQLAEQVGHAAVLEKLRTLVAEQGQAAAAPSSGASVPATAQVSMPAGRRLIEASKCGDLAAIMALVGGGADPNARVQKLAGERYETTALCAAAVGGQLEAVRLLLDHGAVPSLSDSYGTAPLMNAAMEGHTAVVLELLERGTALPAALDAVHPETGWTAYHFGCFNNQADSVVALLRAGCDKAIKDRAGMTGEQCASAKGQSEVLARLAAFEAEQQLLLAISLVEACVVGDVEAVRRLLESGVDPDTSVAVLDEASGENVKTTALSQAAANGQLQVARLLLNQGAGPNVPASGE